MEKRVRRAVHRRRTRSEMESLLKAYERSKDLSIKEFCRRHHMAEGTFYNFRKLYRQEGSKSGNAGGFIAIGGSGGGERLLDGLFAEVNGIRIYQPVTAEYLKSLCL